MGVYGRKNYVSLDIDIEEFFFVEYMLNTSSEALLLRQTFVK